MTRVILRPREVVEAGYAGSRTSLWRAVKSGTFPKPVKLGPSTTGFLKSDLDQWLAAKTADPERAS